jgi:hypothetical protein
MIHTVFDFDDTLFATSWSTGKEPFKSKELSESMYELITTAAKYGKVYIITNATMGWLRQCTDLFLTRSDIFNNVETLSTIDSGIAATVPLQYWKTVAFEKVLSHLISDGDHHQLVSFGDNQYDRNASLYMRSKHPDVLVKNVLMLDRPEIDQVICQHKLLIKYFPMILSYNGTLDMKMSVHSSETKVSQPANISYDFEKINMVCDSLAFLILRLDSFQMEPFKYNSVA